MSRGPSRGKEFEIPLFGLKMGVEPQLYPYRNPPTRIRIQKGAAKAVAVEGDVDPMANSNVLEFTDGNFQSEVLGSNIPVVVDFWAEWCMPCRMLAPTIDDIASTYQGKAKVGKLDVDKNQQTGMTYKITAIPTVLIFKGGELKKKFVGMTNKGDLQKALDEIGAQ